jgi:hypothetical protein
VTSTTIVCVASFTCTAHCDGKNRPIVFGPSSAIFSGTPRFIISGHTRDAPKFENSHHRRPSSALTALRTHGQPTPANASARTIVIKNANGARRMPRF